MALARTKIVKEKDFKKFQNLVKKSMLNIHRALEKLHNQSKSTKSPGRKPGKRSKSTANSL